MGLAKSWLLLCGCIIVFGLPPVAADELGPLRVKNRFPLHLMFLTPRPTAARVPPAGALHTELAVDYSAIYFNQANRQWNFLMDMEMTTIDLTLAYGFASRLAIALEMPLVSMNDGFLDGFLENYHNALGLPNYGREERPKNAFGYRITKLGQTWIDGESSGFQWADMTCSLQLQLTHPAPRRSFDASLLGRIKLPVGDAERGLGSGRYDYGLYLPMQWSWRPWTLYFMPGLAILNDPDIPAAHVAARNSWSLFAAVGYAYTEHLKLLGQLNYFTSPIERTGISELDDGGLELALGFQYDLDRNWVLEFAFCEDLTRAAPDFSLHLGLTWRYILNDAH